MHKGGKTLEGSAWRTVFNTFLCSQAVEAVHEASTFHGLAQAVANDRKVCPVFTAVLSMFVTFTAPCCLRS
jgi:hypothetical protein